MEKRIVFTNNDGGISIIVPSLDCGLSTEDIAAKDVPFGTPFIIVDASDVPSDRTFRGAWRADTQSTPDGHGAEYGAGTARVVPAFLYPEK